MSFSDCPEDRRGSAVSLNPSIRSPADIALFLGVWLFSFFAFQAVFTLTVGYTFDKSNNDLQTHAYQPSQGLLQNEGKSVMLSKYLLQ